jgi:hypothetical protein
MISIFSEYCDDTSQNSRMGRFIAQNQFKFFHDSIDENLKTMSLCKEISLQNYSKGKECGTLILHDYCHNYLMKNTEELD